MYGSAYLDHPDDSKLGIPDDFPDKENWFYVNDLVHRAIENAKNIDCLTNQTLLIKHLLLYMRNGGSISSEEMWQVTKHGDNCFDSDCRTLDDIAYMDMHLTPEMMRSCYLEDVHKIRMRLKKKV